MADVRSLLRTERNARRISHPHATYSTTGTLVCLVCHIQLKSESLWNGHLRSTQHAMRLQRIRDGTLGRPPGAPPPESRELVDGEQDTADGSEPVDTIDGQTIGSTAVKSNKRKADDKEQPVRKRSRAGMLPEGFFDEGVLDDADTTIPQTSTTPPIPGQEIQLPSRPATPLKTSEVPPAPNTATINEDEWAAFEADIAAAEEAPKTSVGEDAVISAPAISVTELASKSREEDAARRKEQQEAELEGEKEDAARKLEDEFDEMAALEEKIRKLKEKREALRLKDNGEEKAKPSAPSEISDQKLDKSGVNGRRIGERGEEDGDDNDDDEDDDEDDDDWDGFRLKA